MADENEPAPALADDGPVNVDPPEQEEIKEAEPEKAEGEDAGEEEAGTEDKPKKPSGAQRAKAREARLLSELTEKQRIIDDFNRSKAQADKPGAAEEKEPVEADFNGDFFAYQQAATAFKAGKAVRDALKAEREERESAERSTRQSEAARARDEAHIERVEDARETITDYDATMKAMDGVQVRQDVIDEIMASDKSALLAYHLAKNPDKLQTLNRLHGIELAREMGRLEGSVRMPAANKQTKAPAPLAPLKGGASGAFDPTNASMEDYVAKRQAGWKG